MKLAILYSNYSAAGKGEGIAYKIKQELTNAGITSDLFMNDWPSSLDEYTLACLIGGDGTINYYVNKYYNKAIPTLIVPSGTGNDFYWMLYGKRSLAHQIEKLISIAKSGKMETIRVDVAQVILDNCITKYYINSVGIGFDGEVLKSMATIRKLGGFVGYYYAVLKNLVSFKEYIYEIEMDGESKHQAYTLLNIANAARTGGGFLISPLAEINDQKLDIYAAYLPNIGQRIATLLKVNGGKHIYDPKAIYKKVDQVSIKTKSPVNAQLDGELITSSTFVLSVSDWKLQVLLG